MVEYVEYKGKKYPFVYDYYAISMLQGKVDEVKENELFSYLVYYSLESGCNEMDVPFTITKAGKEVDFTVKDATFLIGKVGVDKIIEIKKKFEDEVEAKKKGTTKE